MVYRTVQMHNGEIDVESTVGVGTTFIVVLPRACAAEAARSRVRIQCDDAPGARRCRSCC